MNHFRYPSTTDRHEATAIYGNVSTIALVRMMIEQGAHRRHLEAQIIGGAYNRDLSTKDVGRENITVARRVLARERIRVVSEDVGGARGRKVVFNTAKNEVAVMKVDRLRTGDWYPYEENR
jgi:chemotaxis protein CheD